MAVFVGDDPGVPRPEDNIDHAGSREIVSLFFNFDGGPGAVLAPDDLDGCLGEQCALARSTAGCGNKRDGDDGENQAGPDTSSTDDADADEPDTDGGEGEKTSEREPDGAKTAAKPPASASTPSTKPSPLAAVKRAISRTAKKTTKKKTTKKKTRRTSKRGR